MRPRLAICFLAVALSACSSSTDDSPSGPEPVRAKAREAPPTSSVSVHAAPASSPPLGVEAAADEGRARLLRLQGDADAVFRAHCAGCHTWTTATLVNASAACGGRGSRLVVPFDLAASRLFGKVAGAPACGAPMPPTGRLAPEPLAALRAWILQGAPVGGTISRSCATCTPPDEELEVSSLSRDD